MLGRLIPKTKTLAFRLAVLYTLLFVFSSTVVFWITHALVERFVLHQLDLRLTNYWVQLTNEMEMDLVPSLQDELDQKAKARGTEKVFYNIIDHSGKTIASSDLSGWSRVTISYEYLVRTLKNEPKFLTARVNDLRRRLRVMYAPIMDDKIFLAGVSMAETDSLMKLITEVFLGMALFSILLGVSVGRQMALRAISGVEEVSRMASFIAKGRFDMRVDAAGKDEEIARLALTFNTMAENIQTLVKEMKEVNDNIAHDLRTPVTRIRGMAETNLITNASLSEFQDMAVAIIEESDRLLRIIATILEISETESGIVEVSKNELDITHIVKEGISLFAPLCEEKNIQIEITAPFYTSFVGDTLKMQRIISNLLDNAVKFTSPGGRINVRITDDGSEIQIMVQDTGIGIPEKDQPLVFKRFYRTDRSRNTKGHGLGLALALSMARIQGGDITVTSSPGKGSTFTVHLSRASNITKL